MGRQHLRGQLAALPGGDVRRLHYRRGERRGARPEEGGIERRQLALEHPDRLAVGHDVVKGDQKVVLPLSGAEQQGAPQSAPREVEGAAGLRPRQPPALLAPPRERQAGEVGERQRERGGWSEELARLAVRPVPDGGPQGFVAAGDLLQAALQHGGRERPGEPQHQGDMVRRRPREQPLDEPEPALREGEKLALAPAVPRPRRDRRQGRRGRPAGGGEPFHLRRQGGHGERLEHRGRGEVDPELPPHARQHPDGEQRVAAEIEEALVDPHPAASQHLAPDPGQQLLGRSPRGPPRTGGALPRQLPAGQGRSIHLAVGGQGNAGISRKNAGIMCSGRREPRKARSSEPGAALSSAGTT